MSSLVEQLHSRADDVLLVEAGQSFSGRDLLELGDELSRSASRGSVGLIGGVFGRTAELIAALVACERVGAELLCLRALQPLPEGLGVDGWLTDDRPEQDEADVAVAASKQPSDFFVLLPSSGTTGPPKLARHSLARLLGRIRPQAGAEWLLTYHPASFAGLQVILSALFGGGRIYSLAPGASVGELSGYAVEHQVTHISATPTFWRAFCSALGPSASRVPVTVATLGGERATQSTLDLIAARFPQAKVAHIYASTEAGALFSVTDGREGFPSTWLERGIEGVRLRVNAGQLEVLSPRAMLAYAREPELEASAWLATGDLVERRGDRVVFVGRLGRTLNIGGAKVDPEEVEAVIQEIAGVVDARVYGRPSPITGTIVAADVVLDGQRDPGEAARAIRRHASSRLDRYKVPRVIDVVGSVDVSLGKKQRV
jgi:acyl-CoA synthetase (AMP-forming)/AMP-acid ligase II